MAERIIIDTDPGIDDALALLLAFASSELEIAAVTTVSGNVHVDTATGNVLRLLALIPNAKTTLARGSSRPLKKAPVFATDVHGKGGLGKFSSFDSQGGISSLSEFQAVKFSERHAVDEIIYQAAFSEESIVLITLGPLTNIALAINKDRKKMEGIERIVMMGGAVYGPGNITPASEFNVYFDPHAAEIVLKSGIPLTMVGLNVTNLVRLHKEKVEEALCPVESAVTRFVEECTKGLMELNRKRQGEEALSLHDPLAVGVVIDPSFVKTESLHVEVETTGQLTEGMTVGDRRPLRPEWKKAPNAHVCVEVDSQRFLSFFLERLCKV